MVLDWVSTIRDDIDSIPRIGSLNLEDLGAGWGAA